MRLTPRYDGPPVLRFTGPVPDALVPLLRQRRRLGELVAGLGEEQWQARSRCEAWSVQDVVAHLVGTDGFYVLAATAALAGTPTRYLDRFDPVATPAQMVDAARGTSAAELVASYLAGIDAVERCLSGLDEEQWSVPADAPPGHVPLHALARHGLWDGWIHERDIVLPLGLAPVEERDEVAGSLTHVAALSPAFLAMHGSTRTGTLSFRGTDPDTHVVVDAGETVVVHLGVADTPPDAVRLEGPSVELVEALSFRGPFPHDVPDDDRWLLGGLAEVFDR